MNERVEKTPPMTNVTRFLLEGKKHDSIALLTTHSQYTYRDLRAAVQTAAGFLRVIGARKGDCTLLIAENDLFWVAAYLAAMQLGLVCVPLPTNVSPSDLETVLAMTEAKVAHLQFRFAAAHQNLFARLHVLTDRPAPPLPGVVVQCAFSQLPPVEPGEELSIATARDDLAALMFTSGSTGQPRGVMVTHGNIIANTESIIEYLELTCCDRIMAVLPFHYCFGASLLHTHLRVGGSLVLDSRFAYPDVILRRMIETECTGFAGVPSHFQILLRGSALRAKSFPHLRYVQQAGGPLAPQFIAELEESLPTTRIFVMYGQTEATARLSFLPPALVREKLGSVGKAVPGVRLSVLNADGSEVTVGEVGEIVAQGENVTPGYWHAPEETAAIVRNGMLHTGDLATVDEDGFIYIVDRAKEFMKCGGRRVSYVEIKNRILQFPCILEAEVLAIKDAVLGEAVKLVAVIRMPGCGEFRSCLHAFCRENLPQELCPKEVAVVPELPKTAAGKVRRHELRTLG